MPTIWKCSWCEEVAEFGENVMWWEWTGIQIGGPELTYHICPGCFGEKIIRAIVNLEGVADVTNPDDIADDAESDDPVRP